MLSKLSKSAHIKQIGLLVDYIQVLFLVVVILKAEVRQLNKLHHEKGLAIVGVGSLILLDLMAVTSFFKHELFSNQRIEKKSRKSRDNYGVPFKQQ